MGNQLMSIAVAACVGCHYQAGSFADYSGNFPGARQTFHCVELAVSPATDERATGPIVAYSFGNRCHHAVTLDLATVHVVGRYASGREVELQPHDPRRELKPDRLDALWFGREEIEYVDPAAPESTKLATVCADVGGVDLSAPRAERWVCMSQRGVE